MGIPPGKPLDKPLMSRMISESHRRGLFVYGTVSCAVKPEQIGLVVKTFQELIAYLAAGGEPEQLDRIDGLRFRRGQERVTTGSRSQSRTLDSFPAPARQ